MRYFIPIIFCFLPILAWGADGAPDHTLFGRMGDRYGPKPHSVTFRLYGGFYLEGENQDLDATSSKMGSVGNYGLGAGWAFHPNFEAEMLVGFTPTHTTIAPQNVYYYFWNGTAQYAVHDQIVPYVTAGLGAMTFDTDGFSSDSDFAINYGGGVKFFAFKNLAIAPDLRGLTNFGSSTHTAFLGTIQLIYYTAWGTSPPADRDHDGIMDASDRCVDVPETKNGFQDDDGCPDTVPAQTPVPAPVPIQTQGPVESKVVGDRDQDGIPDNQDQCPDQPETRNGYKDQDGCPDRDIDEFSGVVGGIYFAHASSRIETSSYSVLEKAAEVLKRYPEVKVRIEGHTDSNGPMAYNDVLSLQRANRILQVLIEKGIDPKRLSASGFGERRPITTNVTDTGRAFNRRIEFRILNPEVLPPQ